MRCAILIVPKDKAVEPCVAIKVDVVDNNVSIAKDSNMITVLEDIRKTNAYKNIVSMEPQINGIGSEIWFLTKEQVLNLVGF